MEEADTDQLKRAVESQHGGIANFVELISVNEMSDDATLLEGTVAIFDLEGATASTRAYAWSLPIDGSKKFRFVTMLHVGPVRGPAEAIHAVIRAERKIRGSKIQ